MKHTERSEVKHTERSEVGSNGEGVIRIGKKGVKKFAFGDGPAFNVDIVTAFQQWLIVDDGFRPEEDGSEEQDRSIPLTSMPQYHQAAVEYVRQLATSEISGESPMVTVAEALDFIARLREQYDVLADFFRPRKQAKDESPATLAPVLQFSEEEQPLPTSTAKSSPE